MTVKRQLGAIFLESGRINQDDVDQVLAYQRTHGGFFGQAIVALGILTREEIDWALASQFDLPFIFPNADAVDHEAAMLVPADWALAHLAVPIVKAGRSLTVVVADPLDSETLDDLRARTGYDIEMALASASRIRELIRSIYGDASHAKPGDTSPITLSDFITQALEAGAERIGVSVRGVHATSWYKAKNSKGRRPLIDGWATILEDMIDPSPFAAAAQSNGEIQSFDATLARAGVDIGVEVQVLSSASGTEFLLRPTRPSPTKRMHVVLPPSVIAELKLLARVGSANVALPSFDDDTVADIVPQLPALVFGDSIRAAHITLGDEVPGVYSLRIGEQGEDFVAAVEAYDFDAISVDLPMDDSRLPRILKAAPISFLLVAERDRASMASAGINWLLSVSRDQDALVWELRPVNR